MGSLVPHFVNINYPTDVNVTILTRLCKQWINVIPGFALTSGLASPNPPNPGYLQAMIPSGTSLLLFYQPDTYSDPSLIADDYAKRGTITVGEAIIVAFISTAADYADSMLVPTSEVSLLFLLSLLALGKIIFILTMISY